MLYINGTKITNQSYNEIISKVLKLEQPNIIDRAQSKHIKSEQTALILEGEVGIHNISHSMASDINFMGTKNNADCITILISSDKGDRLIYHVNDKGFDFKLDEMIKDFVSTENLQVRLYGGMVNIQSSEDNLDTIFDVLKKSSYRFEIVSQNILGFNKPDLYQNTKYLYEDHMVSKAIILYRYFIGKPMPKDFLEELLMRDPFAETTKLKLTTEVLNTNTLIKLIIILSGITDMPDKEQHRSIIDSLKNSEAMFWDENMLKIMLREVFTTKGMEKFQQAVYLDPNVGVKLYHFVINLKTFEVHLVNRSFQVEHEPKRTLYIYEKDRKDFFIAYKDQSYQSPNLGKDLTKAAVVLTPEVLAKGNRPSIMKVLEACIAGFDVLGEVHHQYWLQSFKTLNDIQKPNASLQLIEKNSPLTTYYKDHKTIPDQNDYESTQISFLNGVIGGDKKFEQRVRLYPQVVVDALLKCDSDAQAKAISLVLSNKDINTNIVHFSNGDIYLCVPQINVKHPSDSLHKPANIKL